MGLSIGKVPNVVRRKGVVTQMTLTFFALHNPQSKSLRDFASSLDAKTQFVASYAPRETVGRANVALRRREHIEAGCNCEL